MTYVLWLFGIQAVLGALDNLWHHELGERLPAKRAARLETALHASRELIYAVVFLAIAWREWHGAWAWALATLLAAEIAITLIDFVVEDTTRRLPKSERVLHTVLAINFGAGLAFFAPILMAWAGAPTAVVQVDYGPASLTFTAFAVGVSIWGVRDATAAARWFRRPTWQRSGLTPGRSASPRRILVTGGTGFIGRHLVRRLIAAGDEIWILTRSRDKAVDLFGRYARIVTNLDHIASTQAIDAIVNLAGAPIAGFPWTARRRTTLLDSRLAVTRGLLELTARLRRKPRTWINASAIGHYGARRDDLRLHEKSPPGSGFQAQLCQEWESCAAGAAAHGIKVSCLRIGLVLGTDGGALPALARPVRFGLGCELGSGQQWTSWVHIDDLIDLIAFVLNERTLAGPINATAPEPVRHERFMRALAAALARPLWPVGLPAWLLRGLLGDLAQLFVDGQRVLPERAIALGFEFRYRRIEAALRALQRGPAQSEVSATSSPSSSGTAIW